MTIKYFLDYEIRSSWWACWVWWGWGKDLAARYFSWKTNRKYVRYIDSKIDKAYADLLAQCKNEAPNDNVTGLEPAQEDK